MRVRLPAVGVLLGFLLGPTALPIAARAHAVLLGSSPAVGAAVQAGPAVLTLRFNSRIDRARSQLRLVRPDRSQAVLPIADEGTADTLVGRTELSPGAYTLRWQVLAVDGHITRGDLPFTVEPR